MVSVTHFIYSDRTLNAKCAALSKRLEGDKQLREFNKINACSLTIKPNNEMQDHPLYIIYYEKRDRLSALIYYLNPLFENKIHISTSINRSYYPEIRISLRKDTLDKLDWDGSFYLVKTIILAASEQLTFSTKTPLPKI